MGITCENTIGSCWQKAISEFVERSKGAIALEKVAQFPTRYDGNILSWKIDVSSEINIRFLAMNVWLLPLVDWIGLKGGNWCLML